jgi:hypothetical protein
MFQKHLGNFLFLGVFEFKHSYNDTGKFHLWCTIKLYKGGI